MRGGAEDCAEDVDGMDVFAMYSVCTVTIMIR